MAEQETKAKAATGEYGVPGLQQWGGNVQEQWITALRTSEKRIKIYDEMSRMNPTGAAMIQTTTMFMKSVAPQVTPGGDSAVDIEMAEHVEHNLHTMSRSLEEIIGDIVLYIVYGFFDEELVYERREDGKIYWRKWAPRHPVTLDHWELDDNGGLHGMWQSWENSSVYIPIEKLLHFTTTGAGKGNPEGQSVLEGAYQPWFYIKNLSILQAIICERLSGTPVINMPQEADLSSDAGSDLTKAKRIVRNVKAGSEMGLTLPAGWEFKYEMPAAGPAIDIGDVIQSHKKDFAETMMMGFIVMGSSNESGSWAMIKDKSAMYISALNTFLRQIASVINRHGIPRLMKLNAYPEPENYPKIVFPKITKIDIGDYAEIISKGYNAGILTYDLETEKSVRETIGLPQIKESGLMLKPNLPAQQGAEQPPEGKDVGEVRIPKEQSVKKNETVKASEFSDAAMSKVVSNLISQIALRMISTYDKTLKQLPKDLETTSEDDWADLVDWYANEVYEALREKLNDEMIVAWRSFTDDTPRIDALKIIVDEVMVQSEYLKNSLIPAFKELIMQTAGDADDKMRKLAVAGAIGSFRYRVGTYANSIFPLYANHANAYVSKRKLDSAFLSNSVEMNWDTGILSGDGLLARYVGANDKNTCAGCKTELEKGWVEPKNLTLIGDNECGNSCRHVFQYKYRSRVF